MPDPHRLALLHIILPARQFGQCHQHLQHPLGQELGHGLVDGLRLGHMPGLVERQLPLPEPGPGEVQMKVRATGVGATNITMRRYTTPRHSCNCCHHRPRAQGIRLREVLAESGAAYHRQRQMGESRMSSDSMSELERESHEVKGALDLLFTLREEFAQWLEEAQDDSQQEALENVLGHTEALEGEYRSRESEVQKKLDAASRTRRNGIRRPGPI
jgi:hypothetical protein